MISKALHHSLLFLLASFVPSEALEIDNYSNATNKRFPYNSSFIGDSFDLSGVGRSTTSSGAGTWGSVIGSNYFLSANHYHPAASETITFTVDNMGSPTSYSYTVGGGFRIGTTDLWLGYTNTTIDPIIARYGVTNQNANNLSDLGLGNSTLYMSGDQVAGLPGTLADHVLGTNQAESFYNEGSGQFSTPGTTVSVTPPPGFENDMIILIENLAGDDTPPLTHEALVEGGDSGSPLFSASGSNLTILGVGSLRIDDVPGNFIDTGASPEPLETRNASAYSYIGSYDNELAAAIAMIPVPEPSSLTLLTVAVGFSLRRKR